MHRLLALEHWHKRNWINNRYWRGFLELARWRRRHRQVARVPRRWRRWPAT